MEIPTQSHNSAYLKQRKRRHRVAFAALRALIPHVDFELDLDLARAASENIDAGAEGALREGRVNKKMNRVDTNTEMIRA